MLPGRSARPSDSAKRLARSVRIAPLPLLCIGLLATQWASPSAGALSALFLRDARAAAAAQPLTTYTTAFPLTEDPISEGGVWFSGKAVGLDWSDVRTTPGKAFGTQNGTAGGAAAYADSTAILNGAFGPDQQASATVFNNDTGGDWNAEVELRLRSTMSAHSSTGYEIEFRARPDASAYCDIVRWNGALGSFTPLLHSSGSQCAVQTGDVIRATIIGSTITAYRNGSQVMQTSDGTFTSGNPGMGFFLRNLSQAGNPANYGFSNFSASTLGGAPATSTPTPTSSPTVAASSTPTVTRTATPEVTAASSTPTATRTATPVVTAASSTPTATRTATPLVTAASSTPTATRTATPVVTAASSTPTATRTATPVVTAASSTPTATRTATALPTSTNPPTPTPTAVLGNPGAILTVVPTLPVLPSAPAAPAASAARGGGGGGGGGGGSASTGAAPGAGGITSAGAAGGGSGGVQNFASLPITVAPAPAPAAEQPEVAGITHSAPEPSTQLWQAVIGSTGSRVNAQRFAIDVPADSLGSVTGNLVVVPVDPQTLPAPWPNFSLGTAAFHLTFTDSNGGTEIADLPKPWTLEYQIDPTEINQAGGDMSRLVLGAWTGDSWLALRCATLATSLACPASRLGTYALIVAPVPEDPLDAQLSNGWFFKEANGFNGAGDAGFAVVDDGDANLWSEFQRLGGVEVVGYPVSQRFEHDGLVTQAFQRMALQWQPDLQQAVPLSVPDELASPGGDGSLEGTDGAPPPMQPALDDQAEHPIESNEGAVMIGTGGVSAPTAGPWPQNALMPSAAPLSQVGP